MVKKRIKFSPVLPAICSAFSLFLIIVNLLGKDSFHILLIGLHPLLASWVYHPFWGPLLFRDGPTVLAYLVHFISSLLFGCCLEGLRQLTLFVLKTLQNKLHSLFHRAG